MFTADDIKARVRVQPFNSLRITTSAGQIFEISHPDLIMIGRRDLIVGRASEEDPTTYEQTTRIAILHVTSMEDLPAKASPTGNGQQ